MCLFWWVILFYSHTSHACVLCFWTGLCVPDCERRKSNGLHILFSYRTFFEFPFGTPTMTNATMQSQGAPQPQQAFTPVYNDKRPPSANSSQLKYRSIAGKYVCKDKLTWKCTALILGLIILMLLGILAYFAGEICLYQFKDGWSDFQNEIYMLCLKKNHLRDLQISV